MRQHADVFTSRWTLGECYSTMYSIVSKELMSCLESFRWISNSRVNEKNDIAISLWYEYFFILTDESLQGSVTRYNTTSFSVLFVYCFVLYICSIFVFVRVIVRGFDKIMTIGYYILWPITNTLEIERSSACFVYGLY